MDCHHARELISADADRESDPAERAGLDAHLDACEDCLGFADGVHALRRTTSMAPAEDVPDLTHVILRRAGAPDVGRGEWLRVALGAIAATLLVLNARLVVLGDEADASAHVGRHLGAFGVALAVGLGYAALRPERAIGLVPMVAALGVTLLITAVIDTATGSSSAPAEALHVVELTGIAILWWISGGRHRLVGRVDRWRAHRHGGLRMAR